MKALVVFAESSSQHLLGWLLKPGFGHVFVCLYDGDDWTMFDPRDGLPVVQTLHEGDYDFRGFFEEQGYVVVETEQGPPISAPMIVSNCVGLTKLILGIRAPWILSPFQLYRYLTRGSP